MVDVCSLDQELGLLQQGCDITGGNYLKIPQLAGLLQYLLVIIEFEIIQKKGFKEIVAGDASLKNETNLFKNSQIIEYICSDPNTLFHDQKSI